MLLDWIRANYDWQAALAFVGLLTFISVVGNYLTFKIPVLAEMREVNRAVDRTKLARDAFRDAVKVNNKSGLYTNLAFYVTILPLCVGFESRPLWRHVVDVFAVLLVFDFMYYLTHRFLFHGTLLRKVHALHHQARKPTYVDALYVHPLETFIGLSLFLGSIPLVAAVTGGPLHVVSMVVATLLFTHLNSLNHVYTNLPHPFRWVNTITGVHAAHHVDMNHGNYATLTMFYDKLFGTYEAPIIREAA